MIPKPRRLKDLRALVEAKTPFSYSRGHVYGRLRGDDDDPYIYTVYSYGNHFPMYVYDFAMGMWYGHSKHYSNTTNRHQAMTRPSGEIVECTFDEIGGIVSNGSALVYLANRERDRPWGGNGWGVARVSDDPP